MKHAAYTTKPQEQKKHPAFILGVDATYFDKQKVLDDVGMKSAFSQPINPFPHELFLDTVQSDLIIREREHCDESVSNDPTRNYLESGSKKGNHHIKQILPYLIVRQKQEGLPTLYYPYRRLKTVGESRLAGNGSIGYGGHVDLADVVHTKSVIDLKATILLSLVRETNEEFVLIDPNDGDPKRGYLEATDFTFGDLFILDNSNDVGELHLGVIMIFDLPLGYEIKTVEEELATLPPMTLEQMLTDETFKPENWTKIYLEYVQLQEFRTALSQVKEPLKMLYRQTPEELASMGTGLAAGINPYEIESMNADQLKAIPTEFLQLMELNSQTAYVKLCNELGVESAISIDDNCGFENELQDVESEDDIPGSDDPEEAIHETAPGHLTLNQGGEAIMDVPTIDLEKVFHEHDGPVYIRSWLQITGNIKSIVNLEMDEEFAKRRVYAQVQQVVDAVRLAMVANGDKATDLPMDRLDQITQVVTGSHTTSYASVSGSSFTNNWDKSDAGESFGFTIGDRAITSGT